MQQTTRRRSGRLISVFLTALLAMGLFPAISYAATYSFDIAAGSIKIQDSAASPGALSVTVGGLIVRDNIAPSDTIEITGTTTANDVTIDTTSPTTIELKNLSITGQAGAVSAISIQSQSVVNTILTGTNNLANGTNATGNQAVIDLATNAQLTIDASSTGNLQTTGFGSGSGIGSGFSQQAGSLVINGGTLTHVLGPCGIAGGSEGCAFGGGYRGTMKSIVINGGTVTANSAKRQAIGANHVEINGGTVTCSSNPTVQYFSNPVIGSNSYSDGQSGSTVITGGTVKASGAGENLGGKFITITGGSIDLAQGTTTVAPTNGAHNAFFTELSAPAGSIITPGALDAQLTGFYTAFEADPYANVYGVSDIQADAAGKVYAWIPAVANPIIDFSDHSAVVNYDDSGLPSLVQAGLGYPTEISLTNPGDFSPTATFQWVRATSDIAGATAQGLTVDRMGAYKLKVTDSSRNPYSSNPYTQTSARTVRANTDAHFTVTYSANGGDGGTAVSTLTDTDHVVLDSLAANVSKTGHAFTGWNTEPDGTGTPYAAESTIPALPSDLSLYAQWREISYEIAFDSNGADAGSMAHQTVDYNESVRLSANAYSKTGGTFTGWNTEPDGSGDSFKNLAWISNFSADDGDVVVIYAQWATNSYTVEFSGNGATSGSMTPASMDFDAADTLPQNEFSRDGYAFAGWNTASDGSGTSYADGQAVTALVPASSGAITLYAQWVSNAYTVKFDGNGALAGKMAKQTLRFDSPAPLLANMYDRAGYDFAGWTTERDGSGDFYADGATVANLAFSSGETVILYAQWQGVISLVSFNGNGADAGSMGDQEVRYSEPIALDTNAFGMTGHLFLGWNTEADGSGSFYADGAPFVSTSDVSGSVTVLYAQWDVLTYAVSFDGNGADEGTMDDLEGLIWDEAYDLPNNEFSRTHYNFTGWNTEADGSGDFYADGATVYALTDVPDETVVLYAQWEGVHYSVSFDGNGSTSGEMYDMAMLYEDAAPLPLNVYKRAGHSFVGWNTEADGSGDFYADVDIVCNLASEEGAVATLYAQWSGNDLTIARLFGTDRYETSSAIAQFGNDIPAATSLIIAAGGDDNFPDALAAASLSNALGGSPVVLTDGTTLSDSTRSVIEKATAATTLYLIGSEASLSADVEAEIVAATPGASVERLAGETRQETAVALWKKAEELGGAHDTAILVRATDFPDALSVSAWSAQTGNPIFMTDFSESGIDEITAEALANGGFSRLIVMGSDASVSETAVQASLEAAGLPEGSEIRLAGDDRYQTSLTFAAWATSEERDVSERLSYAGAAITRGTNHADALSGGALQGKTGSVMLLSPAESAHDDIVRILRASSEDGIPEIRFFGDFNSVSESTSRTYVKACGIGGGYLWLPDDSVAFDVS